jgi:hypothetical protein
MLIPAEFIDISIPRFNDTGANHFMNEELEHQQGIPDILRMVSGDNRYKYELYAYGPSHMAHDIIYIIFFQRTFEPWQDPKYAKRIIRAILFIVLTKYRFALQNKDDKIFKKFLQFINYCIAVRNHFDTPNINNVHVECAKLMRKYSPMTHDDTVSMVRDFTDNLDYRYPKTIYLYVNKIIDALISDDYNELKTIIVSYLFWASIYHKSDYEFKEYINLMKKNFAWVQITTNDPNELANIIRGIKSDASKLIDTLINIALKLYFVYNMLYIEYRNDSSHIASISMTGGSDIYRQKYMKYKSKYLLLSRR